MGASVLPRSSRYGLRTILRQCDEAHEGRPELWMRGEIAERSDLEGFVAEAQTSGLMIPDQRIRSFFVFALSVFLSFGFAVTPASAEVVRIEIEKREPFAKGQSFGEAGAYEVLGGRLFFEVDPEDPANGRITDLKRASVNEDGKVEFWSDFFLLKPVDPGKGNGRLLYDVHNRGNKLALWTFNEGDLTNEPSGHEHAGNGFLMRHGWSLLWTGWNGDVAADGSGRLLAGLPVAMHPLNPSRTDAPISNP